MNSDIFNSSKDLESQESVNGSASCPVKVTYGYIILFNWKEGVQKPFKIYSRKTFGPTDIMDETIERNLKDEFRMKSLKPLKALPGLNLSLFAKVESCKLFFFYLTEPHSI